MKKTEENRKYQDVSLEDLKKELGLIDNKINSSLSESTKGKSNLKHLKKSKARILTFINEKNQKK